MEDQLTINEMLTTTRSVRKRLDFSKPVSRQIIEECIAAAQQAPSGGNLQTWGFVVVTEPQKRAALADLYRSRMEDAEARRNPDEAARHETMLRAHDPGPYARERTEEILGLMDAHAGAPWLRNL